MGTGSFPGVKRPGRDADPSPPSSTVVKKGYSYTSTPLWAVQPVQNLSACTGVHFTLPQCLYKGALYLLQKSIYVVRKNAELSYVILIQMTYTVNSNYSSNRVKWLPSAPTPRSTGL